MPSTGLLVPTTLGDSIRARKDHSIHPLPNTMICGEPPAMEIKVNQQRRKRSRLLPNGLLVASNLGYTIRKRKDNPLPPAPYPKKR